MNEVQRPIQPLSPKSFAQWVSRLPLADASTTVKALNVFFHQLSTEAGIKAADRLGYLEALANPIDIVMHAFLRHFRDQAFPIPERVRLLNGAATELLQAVLTQYDTVFAGDTSWLSRAFGGSRQALAAQRWLHYAQRLYYQHALLGLGMPDGFWRQAHATYQAAREAGVAATAVASLDESGGETSAEQAYARLVLTALAPLQRLAPTDLLELDLPLHAWSRLLEFTPGRQKGMKGPFCIDLGEDRPPVACDKQAQPGSGGPVYLEVNVDALTKELTSILRQAGTGPVRWSLGEKEVQLSRGGLQTLYRYWCKPPTRRAARSPEHETCTAAFGLAALYRILLQGSEPPPERDAAGPGSGISLATAHPPAQTIRRGEMVSHKDEAHHGRDVWDSVYHEHTPMRKRHWSEVDLTKVYRPLEALIEDSSSSGLCISTAAAALNPVKVGDIAGIKLSEQWEAVSVCWIAEEEDRVRFGLRRVGTGCEPAELDLQPIKGQAAHFQAVLATLHDGQRVVIAPRVTSLGNGHLSLESAAGRTLISGTPLLASGRFVLLSPEPLQPPSRAASTPKI